MNNSSWDPGAIESVRTCGFNSKKIQSFQFDPPRTNFKKQTVRNTEVSEQRGSKLEFVTSRVNVLLQINAFVTFDFEMFSVPRFRHYHSRLATISLLCNSGYSLFDLAYQKPILNLDFFFYENILIRMKREPVHKLLKSGLCLFWSGWRNIFTTP